MSTPAQNLTDAYRCCDPDQPLEPSDSRYLDLSDVRGLKLLASTIRRNLDRRSDDAIGFEKYLVSGHRGCGKSTELLRLKAELERYSYKVVYFDIEAQLDLADVSYIDVLLTIAKEIEGQLRQANIYINPQLLESLANWFVERIEEKEQKTLLEGTARSEAELGGGVPLLAKLLGKLTGEIKYGSTSRVQTRQVLERDIAAFIQQLNLLLIDARNQIQRSGFKDLVVIVDGLEKIHFRELSQGNNSHTDIFVHHAEQLKAPCCHIVYTTPISLAYNTNLGNDFDDVIIVPMVKVMNPDGLQRLRELMALRIDIHAVFDHPDLLDALILHSGGVMRDLMRLVRMSTDTDDAKIGQAEVTYAKASLSQEYDRTIHADEIELIKTVDQEKRVSGDNTFGRLLFNRVVLEYRNGERWAAVHPAVLTIAWVQQRLHPASAGAANGAT